MKRFAMFSLYLTLIASVQAAEKMNVLFIASDDLNTWQLSDPNRYTGKVAAPNMLRLARSGMLFTRAYCAAPKCSPSRTSILSGIAPWKSGIYQNAQAIKDSPALKNAVELRQHFQKNGYYVATVGKISHGWDGTLKADSTKNIKWRDPVPKNGKGYGPIEIPEEEMGDTKSVDFAVAELQKKHDKPFFIACGTFHPHAPWIAPKKYFDMYPLEDIVLPERLEDDLSDVPPQGVMLADPKEDEKTVKKGQSKEKIQAYLACTSYADAQLGRVLAALEASPYRDNTLVIFWSDHGYHLGEKMHWGKGTLWEEGIHALLSIKVPGITKPNQVCKRFVSLMDLYPTLVELCALPLPIQPLDGTSIVPLLRNPVRPWDRPVISGYTEKWERDVFMSVRTEAYHYIRYGEGNEEFYLCAKDPHEWTNQIDNPEYQAEISRHRAMLPETAEALYYPKKQNQKSVK